MPVGEICNRDTVIMKRDETIGEAAQLMDDLLELLSEELLAISRLTSYQRQREARQRH